MQQIAEGLDPCAAQYVRLIKRAAELAGSPSNTPEGVELAAIRVWLGVYEDMHGLSGPRLNVWRFLQTPRLRIW